MAQRRHHYERAFERFLRERRVPYISVDEARKALLPHGVEASATLKNFDFAIYGEGTNLLVEVKGRRLRRARLKDGRPGTARMESWVTQEDVTALRRWGGLFGPEFEAVFVFVYWCDDVPPDGLFTETLSHQGRWYTLRCVGVEGYARVMRPRSARWGTVCLSRDDFDRLSRPLVGGAGRAMGKTGPGWAGGGFSQREPIFEAIGP